ncbi:hypothetical protein [Thalassotalea ganghwensis]
MSQDSVKQQIMDILSELMPAYDNTYWQSNPELIGVVPEFDSMTIVNLLGEIEERLDIVLDDDDVTAENFESVNSIVSLLTRL